MFNALIARARVTFAKKVSGAGISNWGVRAAGELGFGKVAINFCGRIRHLVFKVFKDFGRFRHFSPLRSIENKASKFESKSSFKYV